MRGDETEKAEEQARAALLEILGDANGEVDLDTLVKQVQVRHREITAATVRAALLALVNAGDAEVTSRGDVRELTPA